MTFIQWTFDIKNRLTNHARSYGRCNAPAVMWLQLRCLAAPLQLPLPNYLPLFIPFWLPAPALRVASSPRIVWLWDCFLCPGKLSLSQQAPGFVCSSESTRLVHSPLAFSSSSLHQPSPSCPATVPGSLCCLPFQIQLYWGIFYMWSLSHSLSNAVFIKLC